MHEFCPMCSKNGVKIKIKAYQLNLQEAVFMCSSEKCTWPVGYQDVKFIDRPVGKDWSKNWDEIADKCLKNEYDPLHDLWAYTPPQTPGTEVHCKDNTSGYTSTTVPDKVINSNSTVLDSIVHTQDYSTTIAKNSSLDSNKLSINNSSSRSLKPKLVFSESVNYKVEKLPSKGYVFIKSNSNNDTFCKNNVKVQDVKLNTKMTSSTSIVNNSTLRSVDKPSNSNVITKLKIAGSGKDGNLRRLSRKSTKGIPYQKFDFNDLLKSKSTNTKKECVNQDVNKLNTLVEEPKLCVIKNETKQEIKDEMRNEEMAYFLNKINDNNLCNTESTNVDQSKSTLELINYDTTQTTNSMDSTELDFDAILGLKESSSDSGVGHETMENKDLDLQLDELLAGFTENASNTPSKNDIDNSDDFKWINSLFGSAVV